MSIEFGRTGSVWLVETEPTTLGELSVFAGFLTKQEAFDFAYLQTELANKDREYTVEVVDVIDAQCPTWYVALYEPGTNESTGNFWYIMECPIFSRSM